MEGIVTSLKQPEIYSKLIDEFNGHPLPSEAGLSARLLRSFGIKEYAADKAAQVFILNLKGSGFIDSNGNLKVPSEQDPKVQQNSRDNGVLIESPKKDPPPITPGYIEIPIPLIGGKRAYIKIPEDYKPEDCERIAKFVEALK
jgi:hypothetical protein